MWKVLVKDSILLHENGFDLLKWIPNWKWPLINLIYLISPIHHMVEFSSEIVW
jgi:hypothetical protein